MNAKKDFQKVIGKIRKERDDLFPKAMMTNQQMAKNQATVNCGGEWRSAESTDKLVKTVMNDEGFREYLKKYEATAKIERNPFGGNQIRIYFPAQSEEKKEEPKVRTAEERSLAFWERYEIVEEIRNACIRNQFYTRGTTEEYENMFQMAKGVATWQEVDEVIRDIYLHSDTDEKEFEYSEVFKAISKVYNDVWSNKVDMPSDDGGGIAWAGNQAMLMLAAM